MIMRYIKIQRPSSMDITYCTCSGCHFCTKVIQPRDPTPLPSFIYLRAT